MQMDIFVEFTLVV